MEFSPAFALLLIGIGFLAGIINTLAGGGTNLTLPSLMLLGMPAEVANATNRVGVLLQNIVAMRGFNKYNMLPTEALIPIFIPTVIGGVFGAIAAAYAPSSALKPLLLGSMLTMTTIILIRPDVIAPPPGTQPNKVRETPSAWFWLFLSGFYGGFVQAGVGFIMITALAGSLRYDIVRTNALKVSCVALITVLSLVVFVYQDLVRWVPGLTLSIGTMLGAHTAVKLAISLPAKLIKWFLFVMTFVGTGAAFLFG